MNRRIFLLQRNALPLGYQALQHILLFSKQFVNFLSMLFSEVKGDVDKGNIFSSQFLFKEFSQLGPLALGKLECGFFFFCRQDGDEYSRAFHVRGAASGGDGDEGSPIIFPP